MPIGFIKSLFQKKSDTELEEIFDSINKKLDVIIPQVKELGDIVRNISERLNRDELIISNFGKEIHRLTWEIVEIENRIRRLEEKYGYG
jgi:peptidoglycan hydrolase CwlO-like protein